MLLSTLKFKLAMLEAMGQFNEELISAGIMRAGDGL